MKNKIILSATILAAGLTFSQAGGYDVGSTFDFAESDVAELMQKKVLENQDVIRRKLIKSKYRAIDKIDNLAPQMKTKLTPAYTDRVYYPDPTYENPMDIKDHTGKLLYPKGFKFNPLSYIHIPYRIVFLDATRKNELKWAKDNNLTNTSGVRILLTNGKYRVAAQELDQHVFFATDAIIKRFELKHTPAIAEQQGQKMMVKEYYVPVLRDVNNTVDESKYGSMVVDLLPQLKDELNATKSEKDKGVSEAMKDIASSKEENKTKESFEKLDLKEALGAIYDHNETKQEDSKND